MLKTTLVQTVVRSWTMGNQLTFSGGGELDNGLNVSLSFVLDQGDNANYMVRLHLTVTQSL